jgi:hypothetical protein
MGNPPRIKPHQRKSLIAGQSQKLVEEIDHEKRLVFSFKDYDPRQGQTFEDWQNEGLLAEALARFQFHCQSRLTDCFGDSFKRYGRIPAKSDFKHPSHVPPDADWASMHIKGLPCVIGHLFQNIFYVVFLDKDHRFWPTEKRNT